MLTGMATCKTLKQIILFNFNTIEVDSDKFDKSTKFDVFILSGNL